ncbi:hypothetical protein C7974DRAFT_356922 [Boeremia exigua]|uniref:uncharacterized protein n=1 Tax=Boeremia exigua TaxID=749465 RepID=UPI001E8EEEB2|nr:uncharacterized protein C7974DRAFT_356922 [Boeremia exigua]KAH6638500.1 hypothetical protein C7974DRAFT_356922 [Boeremia exigua]
MNLNLNCKALAYPASDLSPTQRVSPCPCFLVFRCEGTKLATLLLVARIPTAHGDAELQFALQYDADNLVPGRVKLSTGKGTLTQAQLDGIVAAKGKGKTRPDFKTLDMSIMRPSPVWCPAGTPVVSPKPGCEPAFQRLMDLAKATTIHVIFDFGQLSVHKEHLSAFKAFSKAAKGLAGFPVDGLLVDQGLRKASWQVFAPLEVNGANEVDAAPPAYEGSRARKRPRQGTFSNISPLLPPRSWTPQSPTGSHSSAKTIPISPATEAAAVARARTEYHTDYISALVDDRLAAHLAKANAQHAAATEAAIDAAVAKRIADHLAGPVHAATVTAAVSTRLDSAVQSHLPTALKSLLAHPSPPAQSPTHETRGNRSPPLPALTPLARSFLPHLRTHLTAQFALLQEQQLQHFAQQVSDKMDEVEMAAADARVAQQGEFETEMDEYMAEMGLLRRDAVRDMWEEGEQILTRGREEFETLGEEIEETLFNLTDSVAVIGEGIEKLGRFKLRKMVREEVARQVRWERQKRRGVGMGRVPRGWGRCLLTHPDPKLLGRRRLAEGEWEAV